MTTIAYTAIFLGALALAIHACVLLRRKRNG